MEVLLLDRIANEVPHGPENGQQGECKGENGKFYEMEMLINPATAERSNCNDDGHVGRHRDVFAG